MPEKAISSNQPRRKKTALRDQLCNKLPQSCTSLYINFFGLFCFFLAIFWAKKTSVDVFDGSLLAMAALAVAIIIPEYIFLKIYKRPSTGLDFNLKNNGDIKRIGIKLLGLYFTIGLVALYYGIFPEYHKVFYAPYWKFIGYIAPIVLISAIPYFSILDKYLVNSKDGYWHVGMMCLGKWGEIDRDIIKQHFLGWLVKVYFLAIMFPYFVGAIKYVFSHSFVLPFDDFGLFYEYMFNFIFLIDLGFVCVGYLLTLKIFDSQVRSTENTLLGWAVAVACYRPFFTFLYSHYLSYDNSFFWGDWLANNTILYLIWGSLILFFLCIYVYATIPFGIRFSNLTHRGILTNGAYRLMKHPAYVSKNISWWLISIPFISTVSTYDAIRHSLLLVCVNILYYFRAKTEERHLSKDPVYREYALAMNTKGICSQIGRFLPFLRYDPNEYVEGQKRVRARKES